MYHAALIEIPQIFILEQTQATDVILSLKTIRDKEYVC